MRKGDGGWGQKNLSREVNDALGNGALFVAVRMNTQGIAVEEDKGVLFASYRISNKHRCSGKQVGERVDRVITCIFSLSAW